MTDPLGKSISDLPDSWQEKLADLLDRYLQGIEQGLPPQVEELTADCPELAGPLQEYLAGLQLLEGQAPAFRQKRPANLDDATVPLVTQQLGDFQLIREIGRGGMGIVYEARQLSLDRKVALKVLPFASMLDPKQIQRFQNEARAAAQLHHPHIVPIFFVGTDRGVHFYAMQYVDGLTLRQILDNLQETHNELRSETWGGESRATQVEPSPAHSDAKSHRSSQSPPSDPQRTHLKLRQMAHIRNVARIGQQAAEALQVAHECGVIHRDIKPSNLMVDAQSKLWITDFGLARCQSNEHQTQSGDIVGTMHYMSPEQARGSSHSMDARTDLYSLGVTLYELLTGRRPFDGGSYSEVLRRMEQGDCKPISSWNRAVPADLCHVVAKAMASHPDDRYATAQLLADDLGRFLNGHPTQARRPTIVKRLSRWAHRNPVIVASAVILLVLGFSGFAVSSLLLQNKNAALLQALHDAAAKDQWARQAEALGRTTITNLGPHLAEWLAQTPGTQEVRTHVLTQFLEYHEKLLKISLAPTFTIDPADQVRTRVHIATLSSQLGNYEKAFQEYDKALELADHSLSQNPEDLAARRVWLLCQTQKAMTLFQMGKYNESLATYALVDQMLAQPATGQEREFAIERALCFNNVGLVHAAAANVDAAKAQYEAAIQLAEPLAKSTGTPEPTLLQTLAASWDNLAQLNAKLDTALAIKQTERGLAYQERSVSHDSHDYAGRSALANLYNNLATLRSHEHRYDDALQAYNVAQSIQRDLIVQDPVSLGRRHDLAVTLNNRGLVLYRLEQETEAIASFQEATTLDEALLKNHPRDFEIAGYCGGIYNNLAMVRHHKGDLHLAAEDYGRAVKLLERALRNSTQVPRWREFLNATLVNYGRLLMQMNRISDAVENAIRLRDLCRDNSDQLFAIASDLAQASQDQPQLDPNLQTRLRQEAGNTLKMAAQAGWKPPRDFRNGMVYKVTQYEPGG